MRFEPALFWRFVRSCLCGGSRHELATRATSSSLPSVRVGSNASGPVDQFFRDECSRPGDSDDEEDLKLKKDNTKTHLDAENIACVQIEVMLKKALSEDKQAYDALQYSIRGQLNSGEGWCETGYDVEYAPRICVAT